MGQVVTVFMLSLDFNLSSLRPDFVRVTLKGSTFLKPYLNNVINFDNASSSPSFFVNSGPSSAHGLFPSVNLFHVTMFVY